MRYAFAIVLMSAPTAAYAAAEVEQAAWVDCLRSRGEAFAAQPESAPVVAEAALGACQLPEKAVADALLSRSSNERYQRGVLAGMASRREELRQQLVAATMSKRGGGAFAAR